MDSIAIVGLAQRWPEETEAVPPPCAFDPAPFGLSHDEAARLLPDECALLETCWEAVEHAGLRPVDLDRYRPLVTCIWTGIECTGGATRDEGSEAAGRRFPTTPALNVEKYAECLSGAAKVSRHEILRACLRLERCECDVALLVGVGRAASGCTAPGCAVVVLRRMPEAVAYGHTIHGVLRPSRPPTTSQVADCNREDGDAATGVDGVIRAALANRSEATEPRPASYTGPRQLFILSGATSTALDRATTRLADFLSVHPDANMADVAHTLQSGRAAFDYRRCFVACAAPEAVTILTRNASTLHNGRRGTGERRAAFLFPGLGDHYPRMGKELYETQREFRKWIDFCSEFLVNEIGVDVRPVLFRASESAPHSPDIFASLKRSGADFVTASPLNETSIGHPSVFIVEYALARLLESWNIRPSILLGHSLGEYVAACIANVFSLEDALRVVAHRARLIGELPRGGMIAVPMSDTAVRPYLRPGAGVGAANSPYLTLLTGERQVLGQIADHLQREGVACRWLETTHAFHSPMLSPIADGMRQLLKTVRINPPTIPYISNLTGQLIREEEVMGPEYWIRQACEKVNFVDGMGTLLALHDGVMIEVGPGQSLSSFAKQHPLCDLERLPHIVPMMKSGWESIGEEETLLTAVGRLWLAGIEIDWYGIHPDEHRRLVPVPTYPFEHRIADNQPPDTSHPKQDLLLDARAATRDERRAKLRRARACEESL